MYHQRQPKVPSLLPNSCLKLGPFNNIDPTLIKTYNDLIQIFLPQIEKRTSEVIVEGDPRTTFQFISKIGRGQYGTVYKCKSLNSNRNNDNSSKIYAVKRISKSGYSNNNVAIYGMNQILRQLEHWKQMGWSEKWSSDEIITVLNLIKIRWEILVMQRLTRNTSLSPYVVNFIQCMDYRDSSNIWLIYECCDLGELQWQRGSKEEILNQWTLILSPNGEHENDQLSKDNITVHDIVIKVLHDVAQGLYFLKKCKIIHRDIKPANILIDSKTRTLKISDYGCSLIEPSDQDLFDYKNMNIPFSIILDCFQRELSKIVGTPAFIPPELCHFDIRSKKYNQKVIDGYKIDIWAFGIMLYCIMFNELPFSGDNEFAMYHQIISKQLPCPLSETDQLSHLIVNKLLNKQPDKRISIEELLKEIKALLPNMTKNGKKQEGKSSTLRNLINKIWYKKNRSKKKVAIGNKSRGLRTKNDLSNTSDNINNCSSRNMKVADTEEFESTSDITSSTSILEEPVLVTDPLDLFSIKHKMDIYDENCEEIKQLRDTHSLSELDHQSSRSPRRQLEKKETVVSSTSLEVITPIKKMIRINNTPEKKNSPLSIDGTAMGGYHKKTNKLTFANRRIPMSNNIMNFKTVLNSDEQDSEETIDDIKEYLKYAR